MLERCPNCRARLDGTAHCRRCGLELELLRRVERARETAIACALRRLAVDDQAGAIAALSAARRLKADPIIDALLGFAQATQRPVDGVTDQDRPRPSDAT